MITANKSDHMLSDLRYWQSSDVDEHSIEGGANLLPWKMDSADSMAATVVA